MGPGAGRCDAKILSNFGEASGAVAFDRGEEIREGRDELRGFQRSG